MGSFFFNVVYFSSIGYNSAMTRAAIKERVLNLQAQIGIIMKAIDERPNFDVDEKNWRKIRATVKKHAKLFTRKVMAKNRVFLDSSVLITAVLSSRGGSFYILTQLNNLCEFHINEYVLGEVQRILGSKFSSAPELKTKLFLILGSAGILVFPNPPLKDLRGLTKIINQEDAPILASAVQYSSYLLTLDNDFFQDEVLHFAKQRGLVVMKPQEFINRF